MHDAEMSGSDEEQGSLVTLTAYTFEVWFQRQPWDTAAEKVHCPHCVSKFRFNKVQGSQLRSLRGHAAGARDAAHLQLAQDLEEHPSYRPEQHTEAEWQRWFNYVQGVMLDCVKPDSFGPSGKKFKEYLRFMRKVEQGGIKDFYRDADGEFKDFYVDWAACEV